MAELEPGMEIADWRLEAVVGHGGMEVGLSGHRHIRLGRPVAIKLIADNRADNPGFREALRARVAPDRIQLDHPTWCRCTPRARTTATLYSRCAS